MDEVFFFCLMGLSLNSIFTTPANVTVPDCTVSPHNGAIKKNKTAILAMFLSRFVGNT